jgi:hypothetical protein
LAVVTAGEVVPDPGPAGPGGLDEHDGDAVGRLRHFAAEHGGTAVAVIENIGRIGARIIAIAPDRAFGDAVVSSVEAARKVCERAGLEIREWDRELTAALTLSPADRRRMAGTGR